ncbi:MAG: GNAT family N-acetyltransferase [Bdellovibrionota bacterium]|nr:GNAT family N-acetyltransferase [Bdellovibrionota bacterium]
MIIRKINDSDFPNILLANNANIPAVSKLNEESLKLLVEKSIRGWVVEYDGKFSGFCIILGTNQDYRSDNYRWVSDHYENFEYLDRVVIQEEFQGRGFGQELYKKWFKESDEVPLLLEVNVKPINTGSIRFHERLGFVSVGEQDTENGKKRVQYMARNN